MKRQLTVVCAGIEREKDILCELGFLPASYPATLAGFIETCTRKGITVNTDLGSGTKRTLYNLLQKDEPQPIVFLNMMDVYDNAPFIRPDAPVYLLWNGFTDVEAFTPFMGAFRKVFIPHTQFVDVSKAIPDLDLSSSNLVPCPAFPNMLSESYEFPPYDNDSNFRIGVLVELEPQSFYVLAMLQELQRRDSLYKVSPIFLPGVAMGKTNKIRLDVISMVDNMFSRTNGYETYTIGYQDADLSAYHALVQSLPYSAWQDYIAAEAYQQGCMPIYCDIPGLLGDGGAPIEQFDDINQLHHALTNTRTGVFDEGKLVEITDYYVSYWDYVVSSIELDMVEAWSRLGRSIIPQ